MSISAENFYAALAHVIRLRTLVLLQSQGELCVCELTHALALSQPMISRHLALLREAGLVTDRRAGVWIYYSLNPALPEWAKVVLASTVEGVQSQAPYQGDLASLKDMPNRPGARCCA